MPPNTEIPKKNNFVIHNKITYGLLTFLGIAVFLYFIFPLENTRNGSGTNTQHQGGYVIPGVPYNGLYTKYKKDAFFITDVAAAVLSLGSYWEAENIQSNTIPFIRPDPISKQITYGSLIDYFKEYGELNAHAVPLTLFEIDQFINEEKRIPLLTFIPSHKDLTPDQQDLQAVVVTGVDGKNKMLTLHHMWYGNNLELSFDEFATLFKTTTDTPFSFLVVEPTTEKDVAFWERKMGTYPERTASMNISKLAIENYLAGTQLFYRKDYPLAEEYLKKVENDPVFQSPEFPSLLKVTTYTFLGSLYYEEGKYKNALAYIKKANKINRNLHKPVEGGSWQGFWFHLNNQKYQGIFAEPYVVLGKINIALNKKDDATKALEYALKILPPKDNKQAAALLDQIKTGS